MKTNDAQCEKDISTLYDQLNQHNETYIFQHSAVEAIVQQLINTQKSDKSSIESKLLQQVNTQKSDKSSMQQQINTLKSDKSSMQQQINTLESYKSIMQQQINTLNSDVLKIFHRTTIFQATSIIYNNHRYILAHRGKAGNIDTAQAMCMEQGGYLAEIGDVAEFNFVLVFYLLHNGGNVDYTYLGSKFNKIEGKWRYMTSHGVMDMSRFSNICYGPVRCSGSDGCLMIRTNKLRDNPCTNWDRHYQFVCEIPSK